jgi:hypothetical protein
VLHPLGDLSSIGDVSTESRPKTRLPNISEPFPSEETATHALNRCVPTFSAEEVNATREGALSAGSQLRRSSHTTSGKFQTARYSDFFLARVEDYGGQSNYSQMEYLSEIQTY